MNDKDINDAVNRVLASFSGSSAPASFVAPVPAPVAPAAAGLSIDDTVARIMAEMAGSKVADTFPVMLYLSPCHQCTFQVMTKLVNPFHCAADLHV